MSDLHLWDQQFCPKKIYVRDVRMKNYLILSGGKTEQIRIINIKKGVMTFKECQGFKALAAHLSPNFLLSAPPPLPQ